MTHTCKVCGVTSDAAEFYKGVTSRCKECHKIKVRENRAEKIEYYRAYDAYRYQSDPRVKKRHKRYQGTDAGKASMSAARKKYARENVEKIAANTILNNRVRDKKVWKPHYCEVCSRDDTVIHGHHHDYAQPLNVIWVCPSCHVALHNRESEWRI
jgi:hypothetical protein